MTPAEGTNETRDAERTINRITIWGKSQGSRSG